MSSTRLCWSSEFNYDKVVGIMTINRFEKIKKFLHYNDNLSRPKYCSDRLYKIRPVVDHLKKSFSNIALSEKLCIDEQMVPFKGKSGLKQYHPQKPKKCGYKLYVLSGIDGLIHNFEIHTGAIQPCPNQPDLKASENIVLTLLQNVPRFKWHKLYFDNWYTSVDFVKHLHNQGIACVGTDRANRLPNCKMTPYAAMKKKGRGTTELWTSDYDDVELRAIKWFDNRGLSTYESVNPVVHIFRFDRKAKERVNVPCPSIISTYNKFMGGVDLLDSLLSLYRIHIRSKKWYHKLFFHFLDVTVVQSWLMHCRSITGNERKLKLREFKIIFANSLMRAGKSTSPKRGRPSLSDVEKQLQAKKRQGPAALVPTKAIRLDGLDHWPVFMENGKKERCKNPGCEAITRIKCSKGSVNLCLTAKSNCFHFFHNE